MKVVSRSLQFGNPKHATLNKLKTKISKHENYKIVLRKNQRRN